MKIIHVYIKMQDQFSFAFTSKITTVNEDTFENMKRGIGSTFNHFNSSTQIRSTYKVLEVRQATESDYKETNTPYFINEPS